MTQMTQMTMATGAGLQFKTVTQMTQMTQWPRGRPHYGKDPTGRRGRAGPAAKGQQKRTGYEQFFYSHQQNGLLFLKFF